MRSLQQSEERAAKMLEALVALCSCVGENGKAYLIVTAAVEEAHNDSAD